MPTHYILSELEMFDLKINKLKMHPTGVPILKTKTQKTEGWVYSTVYVQNPN